MLTPDFTLFFLPALLVRGSYRAAGWAVGCAPRPAHHASVWCCSHTLLMICPWSFPSQTSLLLQTWSAQTHQELTGSAFQSVTGEYHSWDGQDWGLGPWGLQRPLAFVTDRLSTDFLKTMSNIIRNFSIAKSACAKILMLTKDLCLWL